MSGKIPTSASYHNSKEHRKLEIKYEKQRGASRQESFKCRPLVAKRTESNCGNIRNPWVIRSGVALAVIVFVVIFVALYSKMHEKVQKMEIQLNHFNSTIKALEKQLSELNIRIQCSVVRANGTDNRGRLCAQHGVNSGQRQPQGGKPSSSAPTSRPTTRTQVLNRKKDPTTAQGQTNTEAGSSPQKMERNVVYVAWGLTKCPKGESVLVYNGTVASSEGSGFLCLPGYFYYMSVLNISDTERVQLHPVKYGKSLRLLRGIPRENFRKKKSYSGNGVPCAVCRNSKRTAVYVMPADTSCRTGYWRREYRGYLMNSKDKSKRSEFICVSEGAEIVHDNHKYHGSEEHMSILQFTQYSYSGSDTESALTCSVCLI